MDNKEVIENLKKSVKKMTKNISILVNQRDSTPTSNQQLRQKRRKLTSLIAKLIAEQNSLEGIINEREATSVSFAPLDQETSNEFLRLMAELDEIIKADQNFDRIVAIANGIKAASDEIEKITG